MADRERPSHGLTAWTARLISAWSATRARAAILVATALALALVAFLYGRGIRIDTDLRALLPPEAPSSKALDRLKARKGTTEMLTVAVEGDDDMQNQAAIGAIADAIQQWPETEELFRGRDLTVLRDHALYYLGTDELTKLRDALVRERRRAVATRMQPGLDGSTTPIDPDDVAGDDWDTFGDPEVAPNKPDPTPAGAGPEPVRDLSQLLDEQKQRLVDDGRLDVDEIELIWPREDGSGAIVWQDKIEKPFVSPDHRVRVVQARLSIGATDVRFAREVMSRIDTLALELRENGTAPDVRIEVVAAYDVSNDVDAITLDMRRATWWSGSLVLAVLILGFRSFRSVILVLVPLAVAMGLTLALARALYGELNALTAFLFAVLFGMGVDFAVHLLTHRRTQGARADWQAVIHEHLGPLSVAAGTTIGSLFALAAGDFGAFREFGIIAGLGVGLCFTVALAMVPALDTLWGPMRTRPISFGTDLWPLAGWIRWPIVIGLIVFAGLFATGVEFEKDTATLRPPRTQESMKYGSATGRNRSASSLVLLADDPEELRTVVARFEAARDAGELLPGAVPEPGKPPQPWIKGVVSLASFFPEGQKESRVLLSEIHDLTQHFLAELPDLDADARRHQRALEFLERLAGAEPLDPTALPRWAREPFMEKDGRTDAIAHVYVKIRGSHIDELIALQARLGELTHGTGVVVADSRLVFADLMSLLERDARTLPAIACLVVVFLLGLSFRRVGATLACTAAMTLGVAVTLAVMAAMPIRINFFNLVVMPAVLGLGIDTTIYLWNSRSQPNLGPTSVAALLSAATTIAGFSGLLFASHPGLRSIGQLGVLAIGACVTAAFLVLWPSRARG